MNMSNQRLFSGYSKTNNIRLPEDKVKLNPKTMLGASTIATVIKAQKTGDYENVGNALQLHDACSVMDESVTGPTVIGREEVTICKDENGKLHKVTDPKNLEILIGQGWKPVGTEQRDIYA